MRSALLLVLISAIVAAGCGGGSTKDEQPQSRADYIALADVICKNHQSRREDLESQTVDLGRLDSAEKSHQVADLLRQESHNLEAETNELQALHPPDADVGTASSILSLVRAKAGEIDDWAEAYDDLDTAEIRRLQGRIGVTTAKAEDRAMAFGFKVCGSG